MTNRSDPPRDPISEVLDRFIASEPATEEVARARSYAGRLYELLLLRGAAQRRFLLANVPEPMLRAVSERLRDEAQAHRHTKPHETLRLAELAVLAAERMGGNGSAVLAEALAERGNARRIVGDLAGAEEDLAEAERLQEEHGGDPLAEAELLSFRASLAADRRQFSEAIELADRSCSVYAFYGQASGALASLLQLGALYAYAGQAEEGIDILGGALELALQVGSSKDLLHVANNVALAFNVAGLSADASAVVDRARELCDEVGTRHDGFRLDWLAARIQTDRGHHSVAVMILADLRAGYLDAGMPYKAALVSLELALAYARAGRRAELRYVAEETAEAFRLLGVEREAIGALALLARADVEEAAELTARLAAAVHRAEGRDGL